MKTARLAELLESRIAPAVLFAVTDDAHLVTFDSADPGNFLSNVPITGLAVGEDIVALDLRPESGELYVFTESDRLFKIDAVTGTAALTPNDDFYPSGTAIGFDFDPVTDRLHLITSIDEHLEFAVDGADDAMSLPALSYAAGDVNFGANPSVASIAFTNNYARATSTQLFGIDHATDSLVSIDRISGKIETIGALGFNLIAGSFDITGSTSGYLVSTTAGVSQAFHVDLETGNATLVGSFSLGAIMVGMTAAPAANLVSVNGLTASYTELDGDVVTIKISKGSLANVTFHFSGPQDGIGTLLGIDLNSEGHQFAGAKLTISAKRGANGGDGFASVGFIDAEGVDLGSVVIDGDLGRIDAGDATRPGLALKSLTVQSLGALGNAGGAGDRVSHIEGSVGALTVRGDVRHAFFRVEDTSTAVARGHIGTVLIGGSLIGGAGENQGALFAETLGSVKVQGSLVGGAGFYSGCIFTKLHIASVQVGGSLLGDSGIFSGSIRTESGGIQAAKVGGDLRGGTQAGTGAIAAFGALGRAIVGGSVIGGAASSSGALIGNASMGSIFIGGDLQGSGEFSGIVGSTGPVGNVTIQGSIIAGSEQYSGTIISGVTLGAVKIGGDVRGSEQQLVRIIASGNPFATGADVAIKSVSVKGSVDRAWISAGNNVVSLDVTNADAQIGAVKIGGNWSRSTISAGVHIGADAQYGTADDAAPADAHDSATSVSRITSITIRGHVIGTPGGESTTDHFGFVTQHVGSFSVGGTKFALVRGAATDDLSVTDSRYRIGWTGDVRLHEVAL